MTSEGCFIPFLQVGDSGQSRRFIPAALRILCGYGAVKFLLRTHKADVAICSILKAGLRIKRAFYAVYMNKILRVEERFLLERRLNIAFR